MTFFLEYRKCNKSKPICKNSFKNLRGNFAFDWCFQYAEKCSANRKKVN